MDVEDFKSNLIRVSKAYAKKQELYTVYDLLATTFSDIMRRFCANGLHDTSILDELDTIITYVNGWFGDIAYSYRSTTKHVVDDDLTVTKVSMRN